MDTTTIQITTEQKAQLDALKTGPREPYKAVIGRLIDSHSDTDADAMADHSDDVDTDALADEVVRRFDYAELSSRVADDLQGRFS